jgi:hypothetical protein
MKHIYPVSASKLSDEEADIIALLLELVFEYLNNMLDYKSSALNR